MIIRTEDNLLDADFFDLLTKEDALISLIAIRAKEKEQFSTDSAKFNDLTESIALLLVSDNDNVASVHHEIKKMYKNKKMNVIKELLMTIATLSFDKDYINVMLILDELDYELQFIK